MHVVTGDSAGNMAFTVNWQLFSVKAGGLAYPMTEIDAMTLTARFIMVKNQFLLINPERKQTPSAQALFGLDMGHLATTLYTMRRRSLPGNTPLLV